MRVIVSGAGVDGLAIAQGLIAAGHDVVILERGGGPGAGPSGYRLRIDSRAVHTLRTMLPPALFTALLASGSGSAVNQRLTYLDHRLHSLGSTRAGDRDVLMIGRGPLLRLLSHGIADRVRSGRHSRSFTVRADSVSITTGDGQVETGDAVVIAEGVHSSLRRQLIGDSAPRALGVGAILARVPGRPAEHGLTGVATALTRGYALATGPGGIGAFLSAHDPVLGPPIDPAAVGPIPPEPEDPYLVWALLCPDGRIPGNGASADELRRRGAHHPRLAPRPRAPSGPVRAGIGATPDLVRVAAGADLAHHGRHHPRRRRARRPTHRRHRRQHGHPRRQTHRRRALRRRGSARRPAGPAPLRTDHARVRRRHRHGLGGTVAVAAAPEQSSGPCLRHRPSGGGGGAHRKEPPITVQELTELSANVFAFPAGHANAYLWRRGHSATLVDAGEVGSDVLVLDALSRLGLADTDLERIVLTHWHHDHTGGAAALATRTGARVYAGRADAPVIRGHEEGAPPALTPAEEPIMAGITGLVAAPPCAVNVELGDGDTLSDDDGRGGDGGDHRGDGDRAQIIAMPGHTPGSIAVYLPGERVVLTGDIAAHPQDDVILGLFNVDRRRAGRSLDRLTGLDVDAAGFGHGAPIVTNAAAALAAWTDPFAG